MSLRCPLCLQALRPGTILHRFCRLHPQESGAISLDPDDLAALYCPAEGCRPAQALEEGVFLAHEGCGCLSPFWDGGGLNCARSIIVEGKPLDHWQLNALKDIGRQYPNLKEMWFPLILFRAANEYWRNQPFSAFVVMAGARSVGKTVLSLMAMSRLPYPASVTVEHFVHITPAMHDVPSEELLTTLAALNRFRQGKPASLVQHTDRDNVSNLKATFLAETKQSRPKPAAAAERMNAGQWLVYVLQQLLGQGDAAAQPVRALCPAPSHLVIAFYDTAGELWQDAGLGNLIQLRAEADILAVVIDATALNHFGVPVEGREAPDSTWVGCERLENAQRFFRGRRCLIVTKLDAVSQNGEVAAYMDAIKRSASPPQHPKQLLGSWLSQENDIENRLRCLIEQDPELQVFLVWTEGLRNSDRAPRSHGITSFINWCLDIERCWKMADAR